MARALVWLTVTAAWGAACGGRATQAVNKAGDQQDEGAGELAKASIQLTLGGDRAPAPGDEPKRRAYGGEAYGGGAYGGAMYGGDPYGGAGYAGWTVPQWSYTPPTRLPRYNVAANLSGALEGVVVWTGARPARLATACGTIDNPTLRVGSDRGVRGVIVYIDKVSVGRAMPFYGKPASIGGVVVKHGCALLPAAQIVSPLPASVTIHGDTTRTRVRATVGAAAPKAFELQEGGIAQVELRPGVTVIDGDDGKLAPAWVLALDTPYYALTDDTGHFRIDELATGTYDVAFWQAPIASAGPGGAIAFGAPLIVHRSVRVEAGRTAKLDVALARH
ncbi:MAG: carboxypeptidase-like regulatory domain-containing protein [Acidobacteriota bacterium]